MKKKIILVALVVVLLVSAVAVMIATDTPRLDDSGIMRNYAWLEKIFG